MMFDQFTKDNEISFTILNDKITVVNDNGILNGFENGTIFELIKKSNIKIDDIIKKVISGIIKDMDENSMIPYRKINKILDSYMLTYFTFKEFILNSKYNKYFKFYHNKLYMDVEAGQNITMNKQKEQENNK